MYAVWFMGFMLVYATLAWDWHKQGKETNERAAFVFMLISVGSFVVLPLIMLGIYMKDKGDFDGDDELG